MQAVARLQIYTMRINIVLYYCTLHTSNIIVKSCHKAYSVQVISAHCYFSIIRFVNHCFLSCVLCYSLYHKPYILIITA